MIFINLSVCRQINANISKVSHSIIEAMTSFRCICQTGGFFAHPSANFLVTYCDFQVERSLTGKICILVKKLINYHLSSKLKVLSNTSALI